MTVWTEYQNVFGPRYLLHRDRIGERTDGLNVAMLDMFAVAKRLANAGAMYIQQPRNAVEVAWMLDSVFSFELRHRQQPVIGLALAVHRTELPVGRN